MTRLICVILILSFFLSGCNVMGERIKEPVAFYYLRENYQDDMGDVISPEIREASGHRYDLPYLLALYSMGPSEEGLISPLPENASIIPVERSDDRLVLSISELPEEITDLDYTLACSCLSLTCLELIGVRQVTVICGERTMTIHKDNLMIDGNGYRTLQEDSE